MWNYGNDKPETRFGMKLFNLKKPASVYQSKKDDAELIGEEDEENNYYSLGGDNHDDLDETNEDLVN